MTERIGYDCIKVTRDEATELCVYHLRMAAALFQASPDDSNLSLLAEIDRMCDDVEKPAIKVWATIMLETYEEMKDRD